MALSNILLEPRRELTEQAFGFLTLIGIVAVVGIVVYPIARMLAHAEGHTGDGGDWFFGYLLGTMIAFCLFAIVAGIMFIIHSIGEKVCDSLAERGWDPRPSQRRFF